jgi:hypothetical protein
MNLYKKCLYRLPVLRKKLLFCVGWVARENWRSGLGSGDSAVLEGEIQPVVMAFEGVLT